MDHHGLLTVVRQLTRTCHTLSVERASQASNWTFAYTPVIYPEIHCPFCQVIMRSDGIWLFNIQRGRLMGMFRPSDKFTLNYPSHPHDTGGGVLCLGKNRSILELFASTPNLEDCPMGPQNVPQWCARWWGHKCEAMRVWLDEHEYHTRLKELDAL